MLEDRDTRDSGHDDARRYVRGRRDFYALVVTALLNCALTLTVNWLSGPQRWWFTWVESGFGVAIAFSARKLSSLRGWFGPLWERRPLERHRG
jgi:hypothetical protein